MRTIIYFKVIKNLGSKTFDDQQNLSKFDSEINSSINLYSQILIHTINQKILY